MFYLITQKLLIEHLPPLEPCNYTFWNGYIPNLSFVEDVREFLRREFTVGIMFCTYYDIMNASKMS